MATKTNLTIYAYKFNINGTKAFYVGATSRKMNQRATKCGYKSAMGEFIRANNLNSFDLRDAAVILETGATPSREYYWQEQLSKELIPAGWTPLNSCSCVMNDTHEQSEKHALSLKRIYTRKRRKELCFNLYEANLKNAINAFCKQTYGVSYLTAIRRGIRLRHNALWQSFREEYMQNA